MTSLISSLWSSGLSHSGSTSSLWRSIGKDSLFAVAACSRNGYSIASSFGSTSSTSVCTRGTSSECSFGEDRYASGAETVLTCDGSFENSFCSGRNGSTAVSSFSCSFRCSRTARSTRLTSCYTARTQTCHSSCGSSWPSTGFSDASRACVTLWTHGSGHRSGYCYAWKSRSRGRTCQTARVSGGGARTTGKSEGSYFWTTSTSVPMSRSTGSGTPTSSTSYGTCSCREKPNIAIVFSFWTTADG